MRKCLKQLHVWFECFVHQAMASLTTGSTYMTMIRSDNVRDAQRAICALKRENAHYFVYKCANFAFILEFHDRVIHKTTHLTSKLHIPIVHACAILAS